MFKSNILGQIFTRIRITGLIAGLVVGSILISIGLVTVAVSMALFENAARNAAELQAINMRVAAAQLAHEIPGAEIRWSTPETIDVIVIDELPHFSSHDFIDGIGQITGQTATVFRWDPETSDYWRETTNVPNAEGKRAVGTPLGQASAARGYVTSGVAYFGEANILGEPYYTGYQPIVSSGGAPVGLLYVGVRKADVESVIWETLRLLVVSALIAVVLLGLLAVFMARALMRPIPTLSAVMGEIAQNRFDVDVPYKHYRNEIGMMAAAVEVFRENGKKVAEMTEAEAVRIVEEERRRREMMEQLQSAFGEVVDAAVDGDFSRRVQVEFPDPELNGLAGSVNSLVETVDHGLSETGRVLTALANTDLTERVQGDFKGSFARLQADTNAVGEKLAEVVGEAKQISRTLKTATGEILAGANDLADRTTRQAATIEETSAAMSQLAGTVNDNASKAQSTKDYVGGAVRVAEETGESMRRATEAMDQINTTSAKISNIIGMIDDIAFQTNLLALNASVEAARAGEAGKGFSVVAVEVRRLAQSSAEASSEIKKLIEQAANEVKDGTQLVVGAAEKLGVMLEGARNSEQMTGSIAEESAAQATAIEQVNAAVRQMDEMTQHNAALVEQMNDSIEQTEAQAAQLDRTVEVFRLERTTVRGQVARQVAQTANSGVSTSREPHYLSQGNAAIDRDWAES